MKIRVISRDWKGVYCPHDVEWVKGMFLHGSEEELDDGNGLYLLFVSKQTDIPAKELFKAWSDMCIGEEDVEGYRQVDPDTIERIEEEAVCHCGKLVSEHDLFDNHSPVEWK